MTRSYSTGLTSTHTLLRPSSLIWTMLGTSILKLWWVICVPVDRGCCLILVTCTLDVSLLFINNIRSLGIVSCDQCNLSTQLAELTLSVVILCGIITIRVCGSACIVISVVLSTQLNEVCDSAYLNIGLYSYFIMEASKLMWKQS